MSYESSNSARTERSVGSVFDVDVHGMVPLDRIDTSYLVTDWIRTASGPYHGDHRTAYDYGMGEYRITADSPFVLHDYYDNPTDHLTSNYDIRRTEYLSKYRTPFSQSPVNGPDMENAISEAITSALNSLKGQSSNWGSDMGEMRQSVESFASLAMKGGAFIKHMRHGQFTQAAHALGISPTSFSHSSNRGKAIADYWLAYSYGWRPYAQSMFDMQSTIADIVNRQSTSVEGTGSGHASGSLDNTYIGKIKQKANWFGSARCVLKADIANPALLNINKLGLSNPSAIAWELVPFSFCVDWFIPVGNTLSAITGAEGLDFHGGWYSVITRSTVSLTRETGKETEWTTCDDGGHYSEEQFTFNRTALTAFPLPRFYADMTPYSSPRAANALALVRQLT